MNIKIGSIFEGKTIAEVGTMAGIGYNCPNMVPIRFEDGEHAVLVDWRGDGEPHLLTSKNAECQRAIAHSKIMPVANPGIASGVLRISVHDGKRPALVKIYYGEKSWRTDEIHHSSLLREA